MPTLLDPRRQPVAAELVGLGREDAELIPADPGGRVLGAHRARQGAGDVAQEIVAGGVAEAVVEQLESVEIEHQNREAPLRPPVTGDLVLRAGQQQRPVGDSGQRIAEGEIAQRLALGLEPLAPRDQRDRARRRHDQREQRRRQRAGGVPDRRGNRARGHDGRAARRRAETGAGARHGRHDRRQAQPEGLTSAGHRHRHRTGGDDQRQA
jgi:hypothetical protein